MWHHQLPIKGEVTFSSLPPFFPSTFEDEWGNVVQFSKKNKEPFKRLPFLLFSFHRLLTWKDCLVCSQFHRPRPSELDAWVIFMSFSCSALGQARFINSTTCLCCFPLSPQHRDKKCWVFNASIHSVTNKYYVWVAIAAYSKCVCSYWVSVCVFSFRGRKAASLGFVYLATSQACLTNAFWIASPRTFVLCFIHRCDVL